MELIPNWVPSGYRTVNVYLIVNDAERALAFYNRVFSAETLMTLKTPDGKIARFPQESSYSPQLLFLKVADSLYPDPGPCS